MLAGNEGRVDRMTHSESQAESHPPSIDAIVRSLSAHSDLAHPLLVDCARRAVASGLQPVFDQVLVEVGRAHQRLLRGVINATGVLLHTNLGRAPVDTHSDAMYTNLEFDLDIGERGSRHRSIAPLLSALVGSESAVVVNNNAGALLLAVSALAADRSVLVSRGECVEIGGGFRIPEVASLSGARLIDVGTTNRTRLEDYATAITAAAGDVAAILKIHPSNFRIEGFTSSTAVSELAGLGIPTIVDIGSGLLDEATPWLTDRHTADLSWLHGEPGARQALAAGASVVTFSGDKLLGGPQCGLIAGSREVIAQCERHPLMRALRPGRDVLLSLQETLLRYLSRTGRTEIPFWEMATARVSGLSCRAVEIVEQLGFGAVIETAAVIGAGSSPGTHLRSIGISIHGDRTGELRSGAKPVIARCSEGATVLDLRTVSPKDDPFLLSKLGALSAFQ